MKKAGIICTVVACVTVLLGAAAFCMGHLNARSVTMKVGDCVELQVTNPVMGQTAQYISGDKGVVRAGKDGTVTACGPGTTTVSVKTPFRILKCKVYVLGFLDESKEMLVGQVAEPEILGASDDAVFYSSDESVVQIIDGKLHTLKDGQTTLVCRDKGLEVSQNIEVTGIISEASFLFVGGKMQLGVNERFHVSASHWNVEDTEIASVDENGILTGITPGTAEVSCQIDDGSVLQTSIDIVGMDDFYLLVGERIKVPLNSENGFDTSGMTWLSKDPEIVSVDGSGAVRAIKLGDARIVGKLEGQEVSADVHVVEVPERVFTAVGMFSEFQVFNQKKGFEWSSSDESVVKVKDGKLEGISEGTAKITAEVENRTFSSEVSVGTISESSVTLNKNQTRTLELTGLDEQQKQWISADDSIVKVSETGEITPVKEGETQVFCVVGTSVLAVPVTVDNSVSDFQTSGEQTPAIQRNTQAAMEAIVKESMEKALGITEDKEKTDNYSPNSTVKEPEIKTNSDGTLSGPQALIACGDYYNSVLLNCSKNGEKWVYSNSSKYVAQTGTFETMLKGKIRGGNCGVIANWAFRDMGIMASNQGFYGNSSGKIQHYNSGDTKVKKALDASCDIIKTGGKSFKTLMSEGKIEVGDVLIAKSHTYIYRGNGTVFASGHDAIWHKDSSVKTDDSKKAVFDNWVRNYKGSYDEKCKVYYIIRMKDSFVPKYYRDSDGNLVQNKQE